MMVRNEKGQFTKGKGLDNYTVDEETECWIWQGATYYKKKYGQVTYNGRTGYAHRIMYETLVGKVPEGFELDHFKCQNPLCVNPEHLEVVTHTENIRRRDCCKLSMEKADCIRKMRSLFSVSQLSELFSVSKRNIYDVIDYRIWA